VWAAALPAALSGEPCGRFEEATTEYALAASDLISELVTPVLNQFRTMLRARLGASRSRGGQPWARCQMEMTSSALSAAARTSSSGSSSSSSSNVDGDLRSTTSLQFLSTQRLALLQAHHTRAKKR